jgi:hypothetical protein
MLVFVGHGEGKAAVRLMPRRGRVAVEVQVLAPVGMPVKVAVSEARLGVGVRVAVTVSVGVMVSVGMMVSLTSRGAMIIVVIMTRALPSELAE